MDQQDFYDDLDFEVGLTGLAPRFEPEELEEDTDRCNSSRVMGSSKRTGSKKRSAKRMGSPVIGS